SPRSARPSRSGKPSPSTRTTPALPERLHLPLPAAGLEAAPPRDRRVTCDRLDQADPWCATCSRRGATWQEQSTASALRALLVSPACTRADLRRRAIASREGERR